MRKLLSVILLLYPFIIAMAQSQAVNEDNFLPVGGIEQWVTIKGDDTSKPLILFLHGGPGSPLTPYADAIFGELQKDFIVVQWDQRGAGKTFGLYAPEELDPEFLKSHPLSVGKIEEDGIVLSEYLVNRFGKKIILFGTSWGSVLGAKMAAKRPDLFHAYIGHSQLVNPTETNIFTYRKLIELAEEANDEESLQVLQSLGVPPYDSARNTGQFYRVVKKYERKNSVPAPESWWEIASEYDNPKDAQHRADADDYSFLNYAGDKKLGIEPMAATIHLDQDTYRFKIPVYFVQGEQDLLTPKEVTQNYFKKIEAPQKELILVSGAAHGFNADVVEAIKNILSTKVVPQINSSK